MQNKIYFMNNGYFDMRAMLTFGVSAKANENAIGYFGTGFKYAVAIILRLGGSISIQTKNESGIIEQYQFVAKKESIRDQEFDIVYLQNAMDGSIREAGFTTRLGINWKPWMAYRELFCNAKDEGGVISTINERKHDTVITVECHDIWDTHANQHNYILSDDAKVLSSHYECDIIAGRSNYIYYRGIAVLETEKSKFSYNIKSAVSLTEDRTVALLHQVKWPIQRAIQSCDDDSIIRECVVSGDHFEAVNGFDIDWACSQTFLDTCNQMQKTTDRGICESARIVLKKHVLKNREFEDFALTKVQFMALEKAKKFLFKMDVNVDDYPIKTVNGLGENVMGRALDGVIYLSEIPFNMGVKQIASTLLEEWVHNKTGAKDFDRVMQSWLFDKILTLGENINREPL